MSVHSSFERAIESKQVIFFLYSCALACFFHHNFEIICSLGQLRIEIIVFPVSLANNLWHLERFSNKPLPLDPFAEMQIHIRVQYPYGSYSISSFVKSFSPGHKHFHGDGKVIWWPSDTTSLISTSRNLTIVHQSFSIGHLATV